MKTALQTSMVVALLFIAGGIFDGILSIRMLELQQHIQRDRILNFDLSSRLLEVRFRELAGEALEFQEELSSGTLETRVMNETSLASSSLSLRQNGSLLVLNGIRLLMMKKPLQLEVQDRQLQTLRDAFFFERSRQYDRAIGLYKELIDDSDLTEDAVAFSLLHIGYCHAASGSTEQALQSLNTVAESYAGSRYSQTARSLIRLLLDRESKAVEESFEAASDIERARKLAYRGRCVQALELFQAVSTEEDRYLKASCLEKTGKVAEAAAEYVMLSGDSASPAMRKRAGRRLMLIGEFYAGGEKVRAIAETRMEENRDNEALQLVEAARTEKRTDPTPVLRDSGEEGSHDQELQDKNYSVEEAIMKAIAEQEVKQEPVKTEVQQRPNPTPRKPSVKMVEETESQKHAAYKPMMTIQTADNRSIAVDAVTFSGSTILMQTKVVRFRLPGNEIVIIAAAPGRLRVFLRTGESAVTTTLSRADGGTLVTDQGQTIPLDQIARIQAE